MAAICTSRAAQQSQAGILSRQRSGQQRRHVCVRAPLVRIREPGVGSFIEHQSKKRNLRAVWSTSLCGGGRRGATPQNLHMSKLRTYSRRAAPEDGGSPPPAAVPRVRPKPPPPKRGRGGVGSGGGSLKSVFLLHWARERLEGAQASTSTGKRKTVGRLSRFPQDQLKKASESTAPLYARSR